MGSFRADSSPYFRAIDFTRDKNYKLPFGKVHDIRTVVDEEMYDESGYGVFIDVFPLDGFSGMHQIRRGQFLRKLLNVKRAKWSPVRPFAKNCVMSVTRLFLSWLPAKSILRRMDLNAREKPYEGAEMVIVATIVDIDKAVFPAAAFSSSKRHLFEGRLLPVPIDWDKVLHTLFGDYMTPPPPEKRVSTHRSTVYSKVSIQELQ